MHGFSDPDAQLGFRITGTMQACQAKEGVVRAAADDECEVRTIGDGEQPRAPDHGECLLRCRRIERHVAGQPRRDRDERLACVIRCEGPKAQPRAADGPVAGTRDRGRRCLH
ncbi:hypothetical protein G6F31_014402 [Rhizopus arrhizus]|nr:hypothetical protein G6F31_014402 [Rhizopus arrhizus]